MGAAGGWRPPATISCGPLARLEFAHRELRASLRRWRAPSSACANFAPPNAERLAAERAGANGKRRAKRSRRQQGDASNQQEEGNDNYKEAGQQAQGANDVNDNWGDVIVVGGYM